MLIVSSIILARTRFPSSNFNFTSITSDGYSVQTLTIQSVTNTRPNNIQLLKMTVLNVPSQLNMLIQMQFTVKTFNGLNMSHGQYMVLQIPPSFTFVENSSNSICINNTLKCSFDNGNNNIIKIEAMPSYTGLDSNTDFIITLTKDIYVSPLDYNF